VRIFLTGLPGCGKSTILLNVIEILKQKGVKIGGIITPEKREKGERIAFLVKDVYSGKENFLAKLQAGEKNKLKVGKYVVFKEEFEEIALPALDFALKNCDIIVIDEIGRMESFSEKFMEVVKEILESDKPILAVVHRKFVKNFQTFGEIVWVTKDKVNELTNKIVDKILAYLEAKSHGSGES